MAGRILTSWCPMKPLTLLLLLGCAPLAAPAPAAPAAGTVRVSGYLQPRFQAVGDSALFLLRRARFALEGQPAPWASFRAQVEMRTIGAPETPPASPLSLSATDLWVRLASGRWAGTVGQFRVPFSLESLLSSTTLETTERSRIINVAKRDVGVQGQWSVPDRIVVQAAVVNGEGPNHAVNRDNRMAYFARAVVTPRKGLDVGAAFQGYSDSAAGDVQAMYRTARWTARAEYMREHRKATDSYTAGWYALVAYALRAGRLQLVGRVQQYDPSDQVATDRLTGYLVGGQCFFRGDDLKVLADYEVFREQGVRLDNDRAVVQLQVRF